MDKTIYISKPVVSVREHGLYRLEAIMKEPGYEPQNLFIEVEEKYAQYIVDENSDAFLFLMLPLAIRKGYDICCEGAITERFLHNIENVLYPALMKGDDRCKEFKIIANDKYAPSVNHGIGVGTSVTCGVDSTYTIKKYSSGNYRNMELTHLFVGTLSGDLCSMDWTLKEGDNLYSWQDKFKYPFERYERISEMTGLPLVKCFTNFYYYIFRERRIVIAHTFVHTYITMAAIIALKKLFRIYYFPSSYPYTQFSLERNLSRDSGHYEMLLMHVLGSDFFTCFSSGAEVDRIKKTVELLDYPVAQKTLHPCFAPIHNCCSPACGKCLRALLTFDYYDKLDNMKEVFDIERFKKNKKQYLMSLVEHRNHEFSGFSELYSMYSERYPEEMKKMTDDYEMSISPVSRKEYDRLKKAFEFENILLACDSPKDTIIGFLRKDEIKTIAFTGNSMWGDTIVNFLKNDFDVFHYDANKGMYDAVIIKNTSDEDIRKIRKNLYLNKNAKKVFSIDDFRKLIIRNKEKI